MEEGAWGDATKFGGATMVSADTHWTHTQKMNRAAHFPAMWFMCDSQTR
jgi:hypothetical protein